MDRGFGRASVRLEGAEFTEDSDPARFNGGILGGAASFNRTGIYPTEFKVLILPDAVEEVTKGGIIRPTMTTDNEKYATIEGRIIAVSHLAFSYATAKEWGDAKPKPGDRVIFAKYAGVRHKAKDGQEYLLISDKDVVATIEE